MSVSGRLLVIVVVVLLSGRGELLARATGKARQKPNVLLIMTDDQGFGDVRSHGNPLIDTPVLDRLAAESVRFDRFFVSPVCAPTRASLLTGRDHLRTGVSWVTHRWEVIRTEEVTLGEALKASGYATGCFGKWHNGLQYPNHPNGQGFDEFFGFCGGAWNIYFDARLERNGREVETKGYITDAITDAAIEFIEEHRDEPFLCYVPYNAPHSPYVVADGYFDKYKSRGLDDQVAAVYGMVESIDANIGRMLRKLDELNLADDTVVLFLTDNGPNGRRYNGGMKGTKGSVHEGGVRVPLFVRWPGHLEGGRTVGQIAQHIDLLPTILDLCGVPLPEKLPIDGVSLVPLLKGRTADWPDRMLFSHQTRRGAPEPVPGAVRTQQYRLVNTGKDWELYDMTADPGQEEDLASSRPEVTDRLTAAYEKWYAKIAEHGFEQPPIPIGHPEADRVLLPPSAAQLSGEIRFANSLGWTTDWITNWQGPDDRIGWELDVIRPGRYEVTLLYACGADETGSEVRVTCGGQSAKGVIRRPYNPASLERPDRVTGRPWLLRQFIGQKLGVIELVEGRHRMELQAVRTSGQQVADLGGLRIRRVE